MSHTNTTAQVNCAWADRRWADPLTGTEVVCVSPPRKRHYRNNYFRINMCTWDGVYVAFLEATELKNGNVAGDLALYARNMITGELCELGPVPAPENGVFGTATYAVARHSHRVNILDESDPALCRIIQVNMDTGERRVIEPDKPLDHLYEVSFSADENCIYTPWWKEKWHLRKTMSEADFRAMYAAKPGYQEMVRIDLRTGKVDPIFSATTWWLGHPNPHPRDPAWFMCCQEWYGEDPSSRWGRASEHERVRVLNLNTGQWQDLFRRNPKAFYHEHWAAQGRRVYGHSASHSCHLIGCGDLDAGTVQHFVSPPDTGRSAHIMVAPNERFLVGDGDNFDRHNVTDELRRRARELATKDDPFHKCWYEHIGEDSNGGETIWKYVLPKETLWDPAKHGDATARDRMYRDIAEHPEQTVATTPICRFRTLQRTLMMGQRLESNAHVTPDSRWVLFQSSSEDDWFEVWAARVPGE